MMLKKIFFKPIGLLLRLYWRVVKPFTIGVRALIVNEDGEVLLVKHTYSDLWYCPGGGVNKGEHLIDAIKRELKEELNLTVKDAPKLLGTYSNFFEHKNDFVSIFVIKEFELDPKQNLEIETWKFFAPDKIPETASIGTKKRIAEYFNSKEINYIW